MIGVTEGWGKCECCDELFKGKDADKQAVDHAKKHGHIVWGKLTQSYYYNGR